MTIKKISDKYKIIIPSLSFFALIFVFIAGFFSPKTQLEKISAYAANVTINNTVNKRFCCLTAERANDKASLPDSESEFRNLYGAFAQRRISFSSVINPDKQHQITIGDSLSPNLSAMYVGPVGSTTYNDSEGTKHIKHHVYPIELMFEDDKDYEKKTETKFYAYVSQSQADIILDNYFDEERNDDGSYSSEAYEKILLQTVPFYVDGESYEFAILNVYLETNYYYDGLSDVVGDFIMTSYSFPNNLRRQQKNLYFLNDSQYQNRYYMEYINSVYSSDNYIIKLNRYNIVGELDENYLLSFYHIDKTSPTKWLTTFLHVLSAIILLSCLALFFYRKFYFKDTNILFCTLNICVLFIPYLFFKLLFYFTKNVLFMSETSGKMNALFIIIYTISLLIICFVPASTKENNLLRAEKGNSYEITI